LQFFQEYHIQLFELYPFYREGVLILLPHHLQYRQKELYSDQQGHLDNGLQSYCFDLDLIIQVELRLDLLDNPYQLYQSKDMHNLMHINLTS
jgi:hypothetical protein